MTVVAGFMTMAMMRIATLEYFDVTRKRTLAAVPAHSHVFDTGLVAEKLTS